MLEGDEALLAHSSSGVASNGSRSCRVIKPYARGVAVHNSNGRSAESQCRKKQDYQRNNRCTEDFASHIIFPPVLAPRESVSERVSSPWRRLQSASLSLHCRKSENLPLLSRC